MQSSKAATRICFPRKKDICRTQSLRWAMIICPISSIYDLIIRLLQQQIREHLQKGTLHVRQEQHLIAFTKKFRSVQSQNWLGIWLCCVAHQAFAQIGRTLRAAVSMIWPDSKSSFFPASRVSDYSIKAPLHAPGTRLPS